MNTPGQGRSRPRAGARLLAAALALLALSGAHPASAQADPDLAAEERNAGLVAPSIWDLELGSHAAELPTDLFMNFACGTNGGPPSLPLDSWTGFDECRPEESGLREVYFEYDNEMALWAQANNLQTHAAVYQYTSAYSVPIIASGLFDERGFLVGLRVVSDPRVPDDIRERGVTLAGFLKSRFGVDGWVCEDLPMIEGEQAYLGLYEKQRCEKTVEAEEMHLVLESHNYRKVGQFAINPGDNRPTQGYFRSETILEVTYTGEIENAEERAAAFAAAEEGPSERELLAERALDCPGCDLAGADLKRADLTGANLAGADLSGANLHEAILRNANLEGANLTDANLNGADGIRANLSGANLAGAMMHIADFDGADLSGADMTEALASRVSMVRANLVGAVMILMDLHGARLNDANMEGVDIRATWLDEAMLLRVNLTDARLSQSLLRRATMNDAVLAGAELRATDLTRADLRGADLSSADFTEALLNLALLSDTMTEGATWDGAELPRGFDPD